MDKAREFWITAYLGELDALRVSDRKHFINDIHVIEFSAYETLQARVQELENHLDLMVDEFRRIAALEPNDEIQQLCWRGITQTRQNVPVIVQRDKAEEKIQSLEARLKIYRQLIQDLIQDFEKLQEPAP